MPCKKFFLTPNVEKVDLYWTKRARALISLDRRFILESDKIARETLTKIIKFNLKNRKINDSFIVPKSYFLITSFIPEWLMTFPEQVGQIAGLTERIFSKKQKFTSKGHINAKKIAINDLEFRIGPWMKTCKTLFNYGFTTQLNYVLCNLMYFINSERIKAEALISREYVSIVNLCSYLKYNSEPASQIMDYMVTKFTTLASTMGTFDIITSLTAFSRFKIILKINWEDIRNTLTPILNNMSILELGVILDSISQFQIQDSNFFEKIINAIPINDFDLTGTSILLKSLVRLDSPRIIDMEAIYNVLNQLNFSKAPARHLTTISLSLGVILSQTKNLKLFKIFLLLLKEIEMVKLNYKDSTKMHIAIMCVWSTEYQFSLESLRKIMHIINSNPLNQKTIGFSKGENVEIQKNIESIQEALNTTLSLGFAGPYLLYALPQ